MIRVVLRYQNFIVFSVFLAIYFFSGVGLQNSGDSPQYALTKSLVENKSFYLEENTPYVWPDIGVIEGKNISGRSPGESFVAIPFYVISQTFSGLIEQPYNGLREGIDSNSGIEAATSIVVSIFGALSVVMISYLSSFFTKNKNVALFTSVIYGLGTLNWKYSSVFYRHTSHIFFLLLACYGLLSFLTKKNEKMSMFFIALGSAGALFVEPTSFVFVIMVYLIVIGNVVYKKGVSAIGLLIKSLLVSFLFIMVTNFPIFFYNSSLFGSFYETGWQYQVRNNWLGDFGVAFSTPLADGVFVNLFYPNKPINKDFFSPKLVDTKIGDEQSYPFAIRHNYKGVFFQSSYLLFIFTSLSIILKKHRDRDRKIFATLVVLALSSCLLQFKYIAFYSPNSYDTRFFLPFVAIITPLISPFLEDVSRKFKKNNWVSIPHLAIIMFICFHSIFNAWVSNVENYAPHLTGEKRALASRLYSQKPSNFLINKKIILETFPNVYNYKIYMLYASFSFMIVFGTKRLSQRDFKF